MKKYLIALAVAMLMMVTSCNKAHTCRCTPTDSPTGEVTLVNMNSSISCQSITRLGFERQSEGQLVRRMEEVTCEEFVAE